VVIYKVAFPRISQLGRLPGTSVYRSTAMYPEAEATPGVLVLRIDAPIQFFNIEVRPCCCTGGVLLAGCRDWRHEAAWLIVAAAASSRDATLDPPALVGCSV
jgi:hypothetical protein